MAISKEQKDELAKKIHDAYISEFKEAYPDNVPEDISDDSLNEEFGIWLDSPHPEFPEWKYKEFMDDEGGEGEADDSYGYIQLKAMPKLDELKALYDADKTPDDPDESSDKPHDEELAGETTPEEDFMQRAVAGKIPATSNVLAGDLTPEEIEMIQMMRAGKKPQKSNGLAGETTPEEKEMFNITNRLAKNLSKHRW